MSRYAMHFQVSLRNLHRNSLAYKVPLLSLWKVSIWKASTRAHTVYAASRCAEQPSDQHKHRVLQHSKHANSPLSTAELSQSLTQCPRRTPRFFRQLPEPPQLLLNAPAHSAPILHSFRRLHRGRNQSPDLVRQMSLTRSPQSSR